LLGQTNYGLCAKGYGMAMHTQDLVEFGPRLRWEPLSAEQVNSLKQVTLAIPSDVGIAFPNSAALDLLADRGAQVDSTRR
jgi:trimethylamine:corrinoid methyltransferase-like protein